MKTPIIQIILLITTLLGSTLSQTATNSTNPWVATAITNSNIKRSSYPSTVRFNNGAFMNNIGDDKIVAQQVANLTTISDQMLNRTCSSFQTFLKVALPFVTIVLFIILLVFRTSMLSLIHVVEFC